MLSSLSYAIFLYSSSLPFAHSIAATVPRLPPSEGANSNVTGSSVPASSAEAAITTLIAPEASTVVKSTSLNSGISNPSASFLTAFPNDFSKSPERASEMLSTSAVIVMSPFDAISYLTFFTCPRTAEASSLYEPAFFASVSKTHLHQQNQLRCRNQPLS